MDEAHVLKSNLLQRFYENGLARFGTFEIAHYSLVAKFKVMGIKSMVIAE